MDASFWLERWQDGRIGFHEGRVNAQLAAHHAAIAGARRVLVPLCGKAEDLAWLAAQGHEVIGVELAETAAQAFFAEHGLVPTATTAGGLPALTAGGVTIAVGDVFATTAAGLGACDGYYDRAAMIALPPELRTRYVAHLRGLLAPGARGLLVTLEYPQAAMAGPPFAVMPDEVATAWGAHAREIGYRDDATAPALRALGITPIERAYEIMT